MQFKLIMALVDDQKTEPCLKAAREAGATGATVVTSCRGEGLIPEKSFFGLKLFGQRDILLFIVEEHLSREILEAIARAGKFETEPGAGIACQIPIEDTVGLISQMQFISTEIKDQI